MITNQHHTKIQMVGLLIMTVLTVLVVVIMNKSKIDCNDPATWSTKQGVQHCAIDGGK